MSESPLLLITKKQEETKKQGAKKQKTWGKTKNKGGTKKKGGNQKNRGETKKNKGETKNGDSPVNNKIRLRGKTTSYFTLIPTDCSVGELEMHTIFIVTIFNRRNEKDNDI